MSHDEALRLVAALERIEGGLHGNVRSGNVSVKIDAGGAGVWIATTACLVMLACFFVGALWYSVEAKRTSDKLVELQQRQNTQQTYLNAIYVKAPQLRPEEKK